MLMNLTATMDGLAELVTSADLAPNVYPWPTESITVPCVVVGWPTVMTFDLTYQRGGDEMTLPLFFVVGKTSNKDARDALSTILGDASSIKSALDGKQSFGDVRVTDATIVEFPIGGVAHLAVRFDVEVI